MPLNARSASLIGRDGAAGAAGAAGAVGPSGGSIYPFVGNNGWTVASWYAAGMSGGISGGVNVALAATRKFAIPFMVGRDCTVDRLAVSVTVLAAASNIRLGLYASLASGMPGALLADSGILSGAAVAEVSAAVNVALTKGVLYWAAVHSDSTPSIAGVPAARCDTARFIGYLNTFLSSGPRSHIFRDTAFVALSDPFGVITGSNGTDNPAVFMRFSA